MTASIANGEFSAAIVGASSLALSLATGADGAGGAGGLGACCAWISAAKAKVKRPGVRDFMPFKWLNFLFIASRVRVVSVCAS